MPAIPAEAKTNRSAGHPSPSTAQHTSSPSPSRNAKARGTNTPIRTDRRLAEVLGGQTLSGAMGWQQTFQSVCQGTAPLDPSKSHGLLSFFPLCRYIGMPFSTTLSRFSRLEPWPACPVHARPAVAAPRNSSLSSWLAGYRSFPKARILQHENSGCKRGPYPEAVAYQSAKRRVSFLCCKKRDAGIGGIRFGPRDTRRCSYPLASAFLTFNLVQFIRPVHSPH